VRHRLPGCFGSVCGVLDGHCLDASDRYICGLLDAVFPGGTTVAATGGRCGYDAVCIPDFGGLRVFQVGGKKLGRFKVETEINCWVALI